MARPDDAQAMIHGLHYKVGVRGLVFVWAGDEWIRSTAVTAEDVKQHRLFGAPKKAAQPKQHRPRRKREYPPGDYKSLKIGESIEFPLGDRKRMSSKCWIHAKRFGKKFSVQKISETRGRVSRVE